MRHRVPILWSALALLGFGALGSAAGEGAEFDVMPAQADIVFEDQWQGLRLASPAGSEAHGTASLAVNGKLVLRGREVAGGQLAAAGEGLRLVRGTNARDAVVLNDLVFAFEEGGKGSVHARSSDARELFTLADIVVDVHPDGSVLLVAALRLGPLAGDLGRSGLIGAHAASLVLTVEADAVQRMPGRSQVQPQAAPAGGGSFAGGTPDVIIWDIGVDGSDTNDIHYWGTADGIAAYSIATQSCNAGTALLDWFDSGGQLNHPVIGQNMFRYGEGRFTHIGQSWLKHGFCAVNEFETGCAPCGSTSCDTLGIGCADTYWASLNDGRSGGPKWVVNAAQGTHAHGGGTPSGNNTTRGRLQVQVAEIDPALNPTAEYFIEGQYVTADDAAAGGGNNSVSWRRVNVVSVSNIDRGGATQREQPAIYAWQDQDPNVTIVEVAVSGELNAPRTYFYIGYTVTQVGPLWHYEYAIQNLTSNQSARSFTLPMGSFVNLSSIGFHDVDYHSGEPFDGTDWASTFSGGGLTWATDDYATNSNANALRWGTLYNYWYDSTEPPTTATAVLGLFKPSGSATEVTIPNIPVPQNGSPPAPGTTGADTFGPGPLNGGSVGG